MIGVYDYTVVLTYLSLFSAEIGIFLTISGNGQPFLGVLCLMLSGLFDAFDGKVASLKKSRTKMEKNFGIQIDSLADLVAFGILPSIIGYSLIENSSFLQDVFSSSYGTLLQYFLWGVLLFYVLAALIRLAYYNVTEEERQQKESGARSFFIGLPVTSSSLIFPLVILISKLFSIDVAIMYLSVLFCVSLLFLFQFHLPKPKFRGLIGMAILGVLEFLLYFIFCIMR